MTWCPETVLSGIGQEGLEVESAGLTWRSESLLGPHALCESANPAVLQALGSPGYDAFTL